MALAELPGPGMLRSRGHRQNGMNGLEGNVDLVCAEIGVCSLSSRAVRYHACGRLLVSIWVSGMHSLRYGSTLPNPNQDQLDVHRVRWPLCVPPCAPEGHSRCASGLLTGISLDTIRA